METDRLLNDKVLKEAFELKKKTEMKMTKVSAKEERQHQTALSMRAALCVFNLCVREHVLPLSVCVCGEGGRVVFLS